MPKRHTEKKPLFIQKGKLKIFKSIETFLSFAKSKKITTGVLPMSSDIYDGASVKIGVKLKVFGIVPIVHTENPLIYLNDESAHICSKTGEGFAIFLKDIAAICKYHNWISPKFVIWR